MTTSAQVDRPVHAAPRLLGWMAPLGLVPTLVMLVFALFGIQPAVMVVVALVVMAVALLTAYAISRRLVAAERDYYTRLDAAIEQYLAFMEQVSAGPI